MKIENWYFKIMTLYLYNIMSILILYIIITKIKSLYNVKEFKKKIDKKNYLIFEQIGKKYL